MSPAGQPRALARGHAALRFSLLASGLANAGGLAWVPGAAAAEPEKLGDLGIEQLQDLRVETVSSASRYQQKVTEAPASVTIVTAEDIRHHGHRTLAEVLRSVRGVYVTYDRNYSNFGIRGFGRPGDFNTRILLLVDGHRMNDDLYDSALIGAEAILDVDLIERVEVIRGPGSTLYGSNAFFGVINVVTRKGAHIDGLEAAVDGGSFDAHRERLTYGTQFLSGLEAAVSGSHYDSNGQRSLYYREFDTPENNDGVAQDADAENAHNLYASLAYRGWTLSSAHSRRDKQVPTASFGTHFNGGENTTDERFYIDLSHQRNLLGNTQFSGRLSYDRYDYRADYPYNYAAPGDPPLVVNSHDDNYGEGISVELNVARRIADRHAVVIGGALRESPTLYQSNYNDGQTYNFQDTRRARSYGLYAQDEVSFGDRLTVVAGLRHDQFSVFGSQSSPRLAVIGKPWRRTTAKLLFGQAYRAPNAYELYVESVGFSKPNPGLGPEKIRTYELVFEQYFAERANVNVSTYRYEIKDLISQEQDPNDGLFFFRNRDRVMAEGIELGLNATGAAGWVARASYALQRARDEATGEQLTNSPRQLAKGDLAMPLGTERLRAGLDVQYATSSRTVAGRDSPGFFVTNVTLSTPRVWRRVDLSASAYNVLDEDYAYPGSTSHVQDEIPQDGRSFRLKATYRF